MLGENEKNSQFAIEFKKSYIELINELKNMWGDYDFKMGVGDPYAFPEYSKEEIMAMNDDLMNSISQLVLNLSSNFKYKEYHDFIYSIFTYLAKNYEKIRWLSNEIDFDDDGKIKQPIDLYSMASEHHQGKMNFIIGSLDLIEDDSTKDKVKEYVLSKYKDILDKQAEPIIDKFINDLEVFWDQIIFINCKDCENTFFYDLGDIVIRSYNKE